MKLNRVFIKNYRSVEELTIEFSPKCRILVGINESGKSNILKALSMLDSSVNISKGDIREALPEENEPIRDSLVRFVFKLSKEETKNIYDITKEKVLAAEDDKVLRKHGKEVSFKEFCYEKVDGLYIANIKNEKKYASCWAMGSEYELLPNWKKVNPEITNTIIAETKTGEKVNLNDYSLINEELLLKPQNSYLVAATKEDVNSLVGNEISNIVESNLPETIVWNYDQKNLLPPSINIDNFRNNPDSCIPLRNMFALAGIAKEDISKEIVAAKQGTSSGLRNLLKRVATQTTKHFREIWKEYKSIEFDLIPNASNIEARVKEKNYYDLAQRSDGFKRFVTFLLLISADVKTKQIENTLILIDEPEESLHPTGARYLKNELLRISESNYVVYSTHSIFMIDKENIGRHIIVTKENEKTSIKNADESNIVEEEVINNALGYSFFESLKRRNIIFEGYRDKVLFNVAKKSFQKEYKDLYEAYKEIGICYSKGVKEFQHITAILELANRECLIISDCDKPAKEQQKQYLKMRGYGEWKRYDEIIADISAITGEDFVKEEAFAKALKGIKDKYESLRDDPNLSGIGGKLKGIKDWLIKGGIPSEEVGKIIEDIKEEVFSKLKPAEIENIYYDLLKRAVNHIGVRGRP